MWRIILELAFETIWDVHYLTSFITYVDLLVLQNIYIHLVHQNINSLRWYKQVEKDFNSILNFLHDIAKEFYCKIGKVKLFWRHLMNKAHNAKLNKILKKLMKVLQYVDTIYGFWYFHLQLFVN
jgi:hypothetical protein